MSNKLCTSKLFSRLILDWQYTETDIHKLFHKMDVLKFLQISHKNTFTGVSEVALKLLKRYSPNNLSVGLLKLELFWEIYNARLGQCTKNHFGFL